MSVRRGQISLASVRSGRLQEMSNLDDDAPECKPDEHALVHTVVAIRHALDGLLLLVHLLVLGHVLLVAKVVKVAGVGLRIELGHKGRHLCPELIPLDLGKVRVRTDLGDVGQAMALGCDESARHVLHRDSPQPWIDQDLPFDQIPCALADKVVRILEHGFPPDRLPVLQILPRLFHRRSRERRIPGQGLEEHTTETPIVYGRIVLFASEDFGRHVVRGAHDGLCVVRIKISQGAVPFSPFGHGPLLGGTPKGAGHFAHFLEPDPHRLDLDGAEHARGQAKVRELHVTGRIDQKVLGLQIAMDVAQLVERIHTGEHLGDVEPDIAIVQHAGVVEQRPKVAARDVFLQLP